MQPFAPGDRVVAINTDMSGPIHPNGDRSAHPFIFPGGPLRKGVVYHVEAISDLHGHQGLLLTGMRVIWGECNIPWHSSRFRKVEETGHPPVAEMEKKGVEIMIRKTPSEPHVVCRQ